MTAALFSFPTMMERDAIEFDRKGTSNFIRACDAAVALWDQAHAKMRRPDLAARVEAFARSVAHFESYRPDDAESMIPMNDSCLIELLAVPGMLRAFAGLK